MSYTSQVLNYCVYPPNFFKYETYPDEIIQCSDNLLHQMKKEQKLTYRNRHWEVDSPRFLPFPQNPKISSQTSLRAAVTIAR